MSIEAAAVFFERPVPYRAAVELQERLVRRRIEDEIPDTVLFLEHPPVITMGTRAAPEHVLLSEQALAERGIELVRTSRGGGVTYHAPGQVVIYPILKLCGADADSRGYLYRLEQVAIEAAAAFGVGCFRREGMTGAWTEAGKLAAIGVRLRRWVAFHGMSFNVDVDLSGFETIVPCGLRGEKAVSLRRLLAERCPTTAEARDELAEKFSKVFGRKLTALSAGAPGADFRLN